jgi:hypothetical protein
VVVVHVEHGDAFDARVAQRLRRDRGVVDEAVAAEEVGARMVPRRPREREGRALAADDALRRGPRARRAVARGGPAAGRERRAGVEREQAHARRKALGQHVGAHAARGPVRRQRIARRVGRVERHPLVPRMRDEVQVARRMHLGQQRLVEGIGRLQRAEAAALQLMLHMVDARGHLEARHELAAEHLDFALVKRVLVVVDGEHEEAAGRRVKSRRSCRTPQHRPAPARGREAEQVLRVVQLRHQRNLLADAALGGHALDVAQRGVVLQREADRIEQRDLRGALAARHFAEQHAPQFVHRKVGRHLLDLALDAGLRLVLDEHARQRSTSGCSSVLPGESPPTALMCMPGSIISGVSTVARPW